jgi:predicted nucleic acid-binding protein
VTSKERIVVDTNVLISRLLLPASVSGRAVIRAVATGQLVVSEATIEELSSVLGRAKFDPYLSIADRQEFIRILGRIAEMTHRSCGSSAPAAIPVTINSSRSQ